MFDKNVQNDNFGILGDKRFSRDQIFAYDFSHSAEVTLISFYGPGNSSDFTRWITVLKYFAKKKIGHHINVVLVKDSGRSDNALFTAGLGGLEGICENMTSLGTVLNDLLYVKNKTKRTVVFADCAGAGMPLITSYQVPYHSMNLTSLYLDVLSRNSVFEEKYKATNISLDLCNDIYKKHGALIVERLIVCVI
jgi:hypothetical protein